jgi:hypothetical protein
MKLLYGSGGVKKREKTCAKGGTAGVAPGREHVIALAFLFQNSATLLDVVRI